jgi:RNA 3'-phosphate cyclase
VIEIDGSWGEGGGQLVRTAIALCAVTGKAMQIVNVRASRANPGLAPQHLAAARVVASLCDARCEGLELRSTAFSFSPQQPPQAGEWRVDVGTAGSVTLVLQALIPVLLSAHARSRVTVTGGTDVRQSPPWDYFRAVILGLLARLGLQVRASIARRGYYPKGGGEVSIKVEPGRSRPLRAGPRARPWRVEGEAHVANLPGAIAERMRGAALSAIGTDAEIRTRVIAFPEAIGRGGAIALWARSDAGLLGAARVAELGVRAETLGEAAGRELAADLASGATVDAHAADQILVYLAMAAGESRFLTPVVTSHARTAMWLIAQFLPVRFAIEPAGAVSRIRVVR